MRGLTIVIGVLLVACRPSARDMGGGDDTTTDAAGDGASANECADGTELVYTIDQHNKRLSQFNPMTRTFGAGVSTCAPTVLF